MRRAVELDNTGTASIPDVVVNALTTFMNKERKDTDSIIPHAVWQLALHAGQPCQTEHAPLAACQTLGEHAQHRGTGWPCFP